MDEELNELYYSLEDIQDELKYFQEQEKEKELLDKIKVIERELKDE